MVLTAPIGVLGGMGPYATALFFQKVLQLTKDKAHDKNYPHLLIDSNNKIPSRTRHLLYEEEMPVLGMMESILSMRAFGVREVYIPCNSACFFLPQIIPQVSGIQIHNTIEITSNALQTISSNNIMVLGGAITMIKKTYEPFVREYGTYVQPSKEICQLTDQLIYATKQFCAEDTLQKIAKQIIRNIPQDIDTIILACTELCAGFDNIAVNYQ